MHRIVSSSIASKLRYLALVLLCGLWWTPALRAGDPLDCGQTTDCDNRVQASVCIDGNCVSCVNDPGSCNDYIGLDQPFCDSDSGKCWEDSDCWDWHQGVGNQCSESCSLCTDGCADSCYNGTICDTWDDSAMLPYGECVFEI